MASRADRIEEAAKALLDMGDRVREIRGTTYGWERDLASAADALRAALALPADEATRAEAASADAVLSERKLRQPITGGHKDTDVPPGLPLPAAPASAEAVAREALQHFVSPHLLADAARAVAHALRVRGGR